MINPIFSNYKPIYPKRQIAFRGNIAKDTFEKTGQKFDFKLYDPYSMKHHSKNLYIDLNKKQEIILDEILINYNPKNTGMLWDKIRKQPIAVNILKSKKGNKVAYHYMSPDLKHEYGYTILNKFSKDTDMWFSVVFGDLIDDYPEQGLIGPRVIVEYTQNWNDKQIGGIGKLSDKMAVKYCIENGIDFNIISYADKNSHIAHYKRGKRFLPIGKDDYAYDVYNNKYGTADLNEIIENLISASGGKYIDISDWGMKPIYMPENIAQEYAKEIKSENYML